MSVQIHFAHMRFLGRFFPLLFFFCGFFFVVFFSPPPYFTLQESASNEEVILLESLSTLFSQLHLSTHSHIFRLMNRPKKKMIYGIFYIGWHNCNYTSRLLCKLFPTRNKHFCFTAKDALQCILLRTDRQFALWNYFSLQSFSSIAMSIILLFG